MRSKLLGQSKTELKNNYNVNVSNILEEKIRVADQ